MDMVYRLPGNIHNTLPISCLIWNVQGARSRAFMAALKEILKRNKLNIVVLVETHMRGDHAEKLARVFGFSGHTRVDAVGFSGGIWVYWRQEEVTVDPIIKHDQFITMNVTRVRDFNETRYPSERSSACYDTTRRSQSFNTWIDELELIEVEFSGSLHTWARGLTPDTRQSARLDRALCNGPWGLMFENAKLRHLPAIQSDHTPLLISPNGFIPLQSIPRPFKFQATSGIKKSSAIFLEDKRHLLARIAGVQYALTTRKDRGLIKLEAKLRLELDEILHREETLWYQKSRVDWLCDGDRNTTFFHLSTLICRWRNNIVSIKDGDGNWIHEKSLVKNLFVEFFTSLFTEEGETFWLYRKMFSRNYQAEIGMPFLNLIPK
ncbi:uncharacterized protein LOC104905805 [Beta vulgaris subsp. vulgaris]|uniref:uncharacterized protein LOC104905805 n=1 Tax=Beta vulgaris subsp. vulgaris TaxID=3555 RepID=UPI00203690DA|nr:uncharacterized protein LOC104905805 [Beta vulgaris subsp. vulgaris]